MLCTFNLCCAHSTRLCTMVHKGNLCPSNVGVARDMCVKGVTYGPKAGKSSKVQIQIQIRSNLQIQFQIQIHPSKKAQIQIQSKSTALKIFKSNPNPVGFGKLVKSGFKSKSGFGFAHHWYGPS